MSNITSVVQAGIADLLPGLTPTIRNVLYWIAVIIGVLSILISYIGAPLTDFVSIELDSKVQSIVLFAIPLLAAVHTPTPTNLAIQTTKVAKARVKAAGNGLQP